MLKLSYKFKSLDPEGKVKVYKEKENPNTSGFFGGPTIIQRGKNAIDKVLPGRQFQSKGPPLPKTPVPKVQANNANINPTTNLTRTETALLSPSEQEIAKRT